jgi:hypothetical protein
MGNIERCDKCGSPSCCAHWRARATTGYDFVSLQRDEMRAERDAAREQLREAVEALAALWADGSVRAAVGEGSELFQRVERILR